METTTNQFNNNGEKHGEYVFYYDDGKLGLKGNYINGNRDSLWVTYNVKGKLTLKEYYI